jgi:hypothetical protein
MRVSKVTPVVKAQPTKRKKKNPYEFDPNVDKVEWRSPTPVDVMARRAKEAFYKSDIDPAVIIHSNKTHRTVSEAFKDADYATPIWRCESDLDRTMEYLKWIAVWIVTLGIFYIFVSGFEKWMSL